MACEKPQPIRKEFCCAFATLNKTNLYSIAYRLQTAKKPDTREKRMRAIIEKLRAAKNFTERSVAGAAPAVIERSAIQRYLRTDKFYKYPPVARNRF